MTATETITSVDIEFNAKSHRYKIAGTKPAEYIPSVTTITGMLDKPFIPEWAAREAATEAAHAVAALDQAPDEEALLACIDVGRKKPRSLRDEGAGTGTEVHQRVKMVLVPGWEPAEEDRVEGGNNPDADLAMEAFAEWWTERQLEGWVVDHCERIVVHPSGSYVGTFDLVLHHPATGRYRIADFKTSNQSADNPLALYPEYMFQLAAYRQAVIASPEYDIDVIDDGEMVALGKNGQLGSTIIGGDDLDEYAVAFNHLAATIGMVRKAQRDIRALNKIEKARRAEGQDE